MSRHPEVKWAQRTDKIFITILLPDAKNANVKLEPEGKVTFSATAGSLDTPFELNLELYDKVNVEASKINVGLRHILCVVEKAEKGWWKRLLKGEGKTPLYLKVDWDKWVDEDEEDEKVGGDDFGGMDFSGMGGGMGGLGGGMGGLGGLGGGMGGLGGGMGGLGGLGGLGGMGGMDFSGMGAGGMGGMDFSGMGGGDEPDSDDEDQEPPKEDSSEAKATKTEPEDSKPESIGEVPANV